MVSNRCEFRFGKGGIACNAPIAYSVPLDDGPVSYCNEHAASAMFVENAEFRARIAVLEGLVGELVDALVHPKQQGWPEELVDRARAALASGGG